MDERLCHHSTPVMLFLLKKRGSCFSFARIFMWKQEEKIQVTTKSLVAWARSGNSLLSPWKHLDDYLSGSSVPFRTCPAPAPAARCPLRCGSPCQSSPALVTGHSALKGGSPHPGRLPRPRAPLVPWKGRCASEQGGVVTAKGLEVPAPPWDSNAGAPGAPGQSQTAWAPPPLGLHRRRVDNPSLRGPEQALPAASKPVSSHGKWGV